ncbi:unnamed protein product [Candida verbasci]|uniref:Mediator of RNA polymerase II transcription subunit 10 n=1 Tax=Candida verbasci TaxID=1227364 RepID=A0A9W4TU15_9ASCO|nr:unnamed protein product [Candida verbasci]
MTTSNIQPTSDNQPLVKVTDELSNLIESFIELGILVHDNQGTNQSNQALVNKLQQLILLFKNLNDPELKKYPIPIDVISYIEDGRNPDIYTREFVEVNAKLNAKLKGKMLGFKKLQNILGDKLGKEFPELNGSIETIKENYA